MCEEFIKNTINSIWINSSKCNKIVEQFILHLNINILIGKISFHLKNESEINEHFQSNDINKNQNDSDYYSTNDSSNDFIKNSNEEHNNNNFEIMNENLISINEKIISKELFLKFKSIKNFELRKEVFDKFMEIVGFEYTLIC